MTRPEPRRLLTGDPAMARKPGRDVVDLALYDDDPEYRAMIDGKYGPLRITADSPATLDDEAEQIAAMERADYDSGESQ